MLSAPWLLPEAETSLHDLLEMLRMLSVLVALRANRVEQQQQLQPQNQPNRTWIRICSSLLRRLEAGSGSAR